MPVKSLAATFFLVLFSGAAAFAQARLKPADLHLLPGEPWTGTLTYRDYTSNKQTTIEAGIRVEQAADNPNRWFFHYDYPKEPHANSTDTLEINKNGRQWGDQRVTGKKSAGKNTLMLTTTRSQDGKQFRYTYRIAPASFSIQKMEKGPADPAFFERHRYAFTRAK